MPKQYFHTGFEHYSGEQQQGIGLKLTEWSKQGWDLEGFSATGRWTFVLMSREVPPDSAE